MNDAQGKAVLEIIAQYVTEKNRNEWDSAFPDLPATPLELDDIAAEFTRVMNGLAPSS